jgi:hypothetical protein
MDPVDGTEPWSQESGWQRRIPELDRVLGKSPDNWWNTQDWSDKGDTARSARPSSDPMGI